MDSQMFPVIKVLHDGIGDMTDPELKGGTVFDQIGDKTSYLPIYIQVLRSLVTNNLWELLQRFVHFDAIVDLVEVDETIAKGPWVIGINLRDDYFRHFRGGLCAINTNAKTAVPVFIRR